MPVPGLEPFIYHHLQVLFVDLALEERCLVLKSAGPSDFGRLLLIDFAGRCLRQQVHELFNFFSEIKILLLVSLPRNIVVLVDVEQTNLDWYRCSLRLHELFVLYFLAFFFEFAPHLQME